MALTSRLHAAYEPFLRPEPAHLGAGSRLTSYLATRPESALCRRRHNAEYERSGICFGSARVWAPIVRFCARQARGSGPQAVNLRVTRPGAVPLGGGRSAHLVTGSCECGHRGLEVLAAMRGGNLCPDPCLADRYHRITKADHINALI
jgi:hypothetical protein